MANLALICASAVVIGLAVTDRLRTYGPRAAPSVDVEEVHDLELSVPSLVETIATPIVMLEFSDFQCAFCARFELDTLDTLRREFIDTGHVTHLFVHYPNRDRHPLATRAAEAAECARDSGRFSAMVTQLFRNLQRLQPADLIHHAETIGLDRQKFEDCMHKGKMDVIAEGLKLGTRAGVRGTPTFLIGRPLPSGSVRIVKRINGAKGIEAFRRAFQQWL